jgi:hypothetical protein
MSTDHRLPQPQDVWDRFIDELDRQGQAGSARDVIVPAIGVDGVNGKRFGEITRVDVVNLSRIATSLGRRGETIKVLWEDMERKQKAQRKANSGKKP